MRAFGIIACLLWLAPANADDDILVAVASNFAPTLQPIAERFSRISGSKVRVSAGSSGKLYAQIVNGAPYDVFLSADEERPSLLEASGHAIRGSRFTYAVGRLVLYSGDPGLADADCRAALAGSGRGRLAIANPRTAPYGLAATQFLDAEGLAERFEDRLVTGENISQAMQFAVRGGARFGLLAAVQAPSLPEGGCRWPVPASLHEPIRQQAVLLQPGMHNAAARAFVDYLRDEARVLIRNAGYEIDNE